MNEAAREQLERKHRPHLFADCRACGEEFIRIATHVCDPVRRTAYQASFVPAYEPNEAMVAVLEERLSHVLAKHRIGITEGQLRDLALAVEPVTGGPIG